jgi:hypothetical protein
MKIFLYTEKKILQTEASVKGAKELYELLPFSVNGWLLTLSLVGLPLERRYVSTFLWSEFHRECDDAIAGCEERRAPLYLSVCSNTLHVYLGETEPSNSTLILYSVKFFTVTSWIKRCRASFYRNSLPLLVYFCRKVWFMTHKSHKKIAFNC